MAVYFKLLEYYDSKHLILPWDQRLRPFTAVTVDEEIG